MRKYIPTFGVTLLLGMSSTTPVVAGTWWTPSNPATTNTELQSLVVNWTRPVDNKSFVAYRGYRLYLPSDVPANATLPLVIVLHGGGLNYSSPYDIGNSAPSAYWVVAPPACSDPTITDNGELAQIAKNCRKGPDGKPQSIADYYKVVVAFPNGIDDSALNGDPYGTATGHVWNDCTGLFPGYSIPTPSSNTTSDYILKNPSYIPDYNGSQGHPINDVVFMNAMIDEIETNVANGSITFPSSTGGNSTRATINDKKVFVSGMSNGANMALRLARELSGRIAAAAIESGGEGARPTNPANWVANKPKNTPTYVLPANSGNSNTPYLPLLPSDTNASNPGACTASQTNLPDPSNPNHPAGPVPLFLVKGNADIFVAYRGGTSNSSSSTWYIPYNNDVTGTVTGADLNSFPNYPWAPLAWPKLGVSYVDPWQFTFTAQPGMATASPLSCNSSTRTCQETNAPTSPAGQTTIGNILARYSITSPPSAYLLQTYYGVDETNTNGHSGTSPVKSDIVSRSGQSGTCDQYGSGRSAVVSCIATNNGHIQPSTLIRYTDENYGMLTLGNQDHDMETALEEWLFFSQQQQHP